MTILQLKAQHDALQKSAMTRDPLRALAEFVWNALVVTQFDFQD